MNRWEPCSGIRAILEGHAEAVEVIYNIFDQNPEDALFPICRMKDAAVIARVPFDEGTLTGTLTLDSKWPAGDWRKTYFVPENLKSSVAHAEALRLLIPASLSMAEIVLRFILANTDVTIRGELEEACVRQVAAYWPNSDLGCAMEIDAQWIDLRQCRTGQSV